MSSNDHSSDGIGQILTIVSEDIGVQIFDEWTSTDQYVFRGPHGRLESVTWSDELGHWKRGPYCIEETLRDRLSKAIRGHTQWSGWRYVRRNDLGEAEAVVVDGVSTPVRCTLCHERFPSGNAFGWHLADIHERDTDDKSQYWTKVPENQQTLGRFIADGGQPVDAIDQEPDCPECEHGRLRYDYGDDSWICTNTSCSNKVFSSAEIHLLQAEAKQTEDRQ